MCLEFQKTAALAWTLLEKCPTPPEEFSYQCFYAYKVVVPYSDHISTACQYGRVTSGVNLPEHTLDVCAGVIGEGALHLCTTKETTWLGDVVRVVVDLEDIIAFSIDSKELCVLRYYFPPEDYRRLLSKESDRN